MKKNAIVMNINRNTEAKRMEIVFSTKPTKATLNALHELNFLYRNINGELMWICTDKYLNKDEYNTFVTTICKDYKKVVTTDGKAVKKAEAKAEPKTETKPAKATKTTKKTTAKKAAKAEPQTDRVAELEKQLAELTKIVQTQNEALQILAKASIKANTETETKTTKKTTKKAEAKAEPKMEAKAKTEIKGHKRTQQVVLMVNGRVVR